MHSPRSLAHRALQVIISCRTCQRFDRQSYDVAPIGADAKLKCEKYGNKGADTAQINSVSGPPQQVVREDPRKPRLDHDKGRH
jgi:hypothetical protein